MYFILFGTRLTFSRANQFSLLNHISYFKINDKESRKATLWTSSMRDDVIVQGYYVFQVHLEL